MKAEWIKLLGEEAWLRLRANRAAQAPVQGTSDEIDHQPVVRCHIAFTPCQWLLSEVDEDGIAFCLADLGVGCPELGYVSLDELVDLNVHGLRVTRDALWQPRMTIAQYARDAMSAGHIRA